MAELTQAQSIASRTPQWRKRLKGFSLGEAGIYYALALILLVLTVLSRVLESTEFSRSGQSRQHSLSSLLRRHHCGADDARSDQRQFRSSVASTAAISAACVLLLSDAVGIFPAMLISLVPGVLVGLVNAAGRAGPRHQRLHRDIGDHDRARGVLLIITGGRTASAEDREALWPLKWLENGFWTVPNLLWCGGAVAIIAAALMWWRRRGVLPLFWGGVGVVLLVGGCFIDASWPLAKPVYYMAAVTAVAWCVTRFTIVGRRLQAVGADPEAARLMGISINRYRTVPFVLNGLAASFVGLLFAARLGAVLPNAMSGMELTVITAAILGGTSLFGGSGSVLKSVAGAVVLYTLVNGFDILGLGTSYQGVIEGVVLIIAAAIYTIGKRGRRG